jgi:hypothetical protein
MQFFRLGIRNSYIRLFQYNLSASVNSIGVLTQQRSPKGRSPTPPFRLRRLLLFLPRAVRTSGQRLTLSFSVELDR